MESSAEVFILVYLYVFRGAEHDPGVCQQKFGWEFLLLAKITFFGEPLGGYFNITIFIVTEIFNFFFYSNSISVTKNNSDVCQQKFRSSNIFRPKQQNFKFSFFFRLSLFCSFFGLSLISPKVYVLQKSWLLHFQSTLNFLKVHIKISFICPKVPEKKLFKHEFFLISISEECSF